MSKLNSTNDKYNFALYVPVIKHDKWELVDNKVILHFTVKDPVRIFAGWLVKKSPKTQLDFDELCSKVWCLIDGNRSIYDIYKEMSKGSSNPDDELRRLITFIKYCSKRGWVSFKEAKTQEENEAK
ncbi:hypothetical protein [Clostridium polynesiense]|uniref:hypothetical protein n=1 Tax=Clostridium polynesiense TaxID=1325933 RepID=UPI00058E87BA|nr:hypothetical protein [Clostridium polynesiense]